MGQTSAQAKASKKGFIELEGQVTELLPNSMCRVTLENGTEVLGIMSGKMRMFKIKVLPGDRVTLEMTPYDLTKGRIIYRHNTNT
ncbi:MAG: translation initiation factor IF-1 [Candidatus Kerfeldbacteria bacterium]|nr:translation initiation factor IF-1 [Candidatus Kerfeldbacteria bacterium]